MQKTLYLLLCLACSALARAQVLSYRCWFDHDDGNAQTISADCNARLTLDCGALQPGLHELHVMAIYDDGGNGVATPPRRDGW